MATAEIEELEPRSTELEERLKIMLLPEDPNDRRNVILEIRAGTGGDEAAFFAGDLLSMYHRYAEIQAWKIRSATRDTGPAASRKWSPKSRATRSFRD